MTFLLFLGVRLGSDPPQPIFTHNGSNDVDSRTSYSERKLLRSRTVPVTAAAANKTVGLSINCRDLSRKMFSFAIYITKIKCRLVLIRAFINIGGLLS